MGGKRRNANIATVILFEPSEELEHYFIEAGGILHLQAMRGGWQRRLFNVRQALFQCIVCQNKLFRPHLTVD